MSGWIVAALTLNVAFVAAAIVVALRIASGRNRARSADPQPTRRPPPADAAHDAPAPAAPFSSAEMRRVEWRALRAAAGAARIDYLRELQAARQQPRHRALFRAKHELAVAEQRLNRFERQMVAVAGAP